jgi:SAM-dependent MidA family methyltransferase
MGRNSLRERIVEEIRRSGPIPFSRYMEMCLYEPELGYYARPREQFGKAGDFYTSSDVHAVFGRLLARQFVQIWRIFGSPDRIDFLELGPGRGLFAADVLDWSAKRFPEFARALRYQLLEQSARLRERLRESLARHLEAGHAKVIDSLEELVLLMNPSSRSERNNLAQHGAEGGMLGSRTKKDPESCSDGTQLSDDNHECQETPLIVFANEFFDALPVDIVDHRGAVRVAEEQGRFVEQFVPPSQEELEYIDRYSVHPEEGERVEVSISGLNWMDGISELFRKRPGFAMFIDYGYTREEQLAGRHRDTLMTYRRHRTSSSPYEASGERDITAHVNFTALRARAAERGFDDLGLVTQTQLLLGIGEQTEFADAFQDCELPQERAKVALQLRHLLSPEEMGEKFHALLLSHSVPKEDSATLSALKWLRG